MGLFTQITKQLFGQGKDVDDGEIIVDGEIIRPGEPNTPVEETTQNAASGKSSEDDLTATAPEQNLPCPIPETLPSDELLLQKPGSPPAEDKGPWKLPQDYLIYLQASNKSERTIKEYCYDLNTWNRQYPLNKITRNQIEKAVSKLHPATARRKIAALRSLAKWQLREGKTRLHTVLGQIIPPKVPGRVPKDRGAEEFLQLVNRAKLLCDQQDRRGIWLGLMIGCGLRISEIRTAELAGSGTIKVCGKGDKERLLPAPVWLRESIQQQPGNTWKKSRQTIWQEMKQLGIKKPHSLRHTYASELIRQKFAVAEAQKLLGHSKIDTTMVYAQIKVPENVTQKLGIE